jgi:hypothetical protein
MIPMQKYSGKVFGILSLLPIQPIQRKKTATR